MKINDRSAAIEPRPAPTEQRPAQWEYLSRVMDLDADLMQYGSEGWELVTVVSIPHDPSRAVYHFKRRRR